MPAVGLGLLASGVTSLAPIALAVSSLGLALGADTDVWPYLVSKYFGQDIYGMVLGFMFGAMALSVGTGALLLSLMLKLSSGFTPFLILGAGAVLSGSALLSLLGREQSTGATRAVAAIG